LFLFQSPLPGTIEIPDDGYGWMDQEQFQRVSLDQGIHLDLFSRNMGFDVGDVHCTMYYCIDLENENDIV
jgi:hypothetical protein